MVDLLNGNLFQNKELIFYGTGSRADRMQRLYESYGYTIKYYCYSSAKGNGKELHNGVTVFSLQELMDYCETACEQVVIQIASSYEEEILQDLQQRKIKASLLVYNDFRFFMRCQKLHFLEKGNENYRKVALADFANYRKYVARNFAWAQLDYYNLEKDTVNIILSSPKTGSTTLYESCRASKKIIEPLYISYTMQPFSKEFFKAIEPCKKKYIGGVREPVSQMLSMLFFLWYTRDSMFDSIYKFPDIGDCQYWFDEHFVNKEKEDNALEIFCDIMKTSCGVLDFYENDYKEMIGVNLFDYEFNKEQGYALIKEGNTEIFIYRLDKMDSLAGKIGAYLGDDEFKIFSANRSEDRIYREMYKKAGEQIKIKRKFLEECYNSKLVRWCYTEEEIEGFYKKWEKNFVD